MTVIIGIDVHDVRFPTAAAGRRLRRDQPGRLLGHATSSCTPTRAWSGAGLHLHQRAGQRDHLRRRRGARPPRRRPARSRRSRPSRWRSGGRSPPTCSCAGWARRRASSTWPPARWSTRCGTCGPSSPASRCGSSWPRCPPTNWSPRSTSDHISDALTPAEARAILDKGLVGYEERLAPAPARAASRRTRRRSAGSATRTSKVRELTRAGVRRGLAGDEDEGRRRHRGRPAPGPDHPRRRSGRTRCS